MASTAGRIDGFEGDGEPNQMGARREPGLRQAWAASWREAVRTAPFYLHRTGVGRLLIPRIPPWGRMAQDDTSLELKRAHARLPHTAAQAA